uniref:Uncharacterized protein n=1 Tax=Rhizophora mucronata TaxID=61149 RepID=A0A2P2N329_RHIMU
MQRKLVHDTQNLWQQSTVYCIATRKLVLNNGEKVI